MIPTMFGGSTIASGPNVAVILRQQLAYLYIIDYGCADHAASDKT
jgi:hypothetical protein